MLLLVFEFYMSEYPYQLVLLFLPLLKQEWRSPHLLRNSMPYMRHLLILHPQYDPQLLGFFSPYLHLLFHNCKTLSNFTTGFKVNLTSKIITPCEESNISCSIMFRI